MKIATIIGARPQFIKAATVSRAIREHNQSKPSTELKEIIIHTGQHYDRNMSDVFFEEMEIPKPDYFLNIHGLSHGAMTGQMLEKIEEVLKTEKPDMALVYGDTNTTLAGALAASKLHIPTAHVEAGLRSFNRRMPEEINRVLTDHVSAFLFCPTTQAVENLKAEGIVDSDRLNRHVCLVGDVMLDAAMFYAEKASSKSSIVKNLKEKYPHVSDKFVLCTVHRQENTDDPERLAAIFTSLDRIAKEISVVVPLHPRTRKYLQQIDNNCLTNKNLILTEPVSYFDMIQLLQNCALVMTDSGGLQKEAYFFKKLCVTLREETEWVELVNYGYNSITHLNSTDIYKAYTKMRYKVISMDNDLYGNGYASFEILNILLKLKSYV